MVSSRREPIIIGVNEFRAKTEAAFFRSMRARCGVDERMRGADADDLAALVESKGLDWV